MTKYKTTKYIDPQFVPYKDTGLARAMTYWLYADPAANPLFANPSMWEDGPRVTFVSRSVTFGTSASPVAASGGTLTKTLDQVFGGKNAVVFSQTATSRPSAAAAIQTLPQTSYCKIKQLRSFLSFEVEEQPLENAFGTVPGQPFTLPIPKFWYGPDARDFTVTNNSNDNRIITVSFLAAVLDTGR
jgi:hypothetical protein